MHQSTCFFHNQKRPGFEARLASACHNNIAIIVWGIVSACVMCSGISTVWVEFKLCFDCPDVNCLC